jgi:hypothetical protein
MTAATLAKQCAWCLRVADARGRYRGTPRPLLPAPSSHGVCPPCTRAMLAEIGRTKEVAA